MSRTKKELLSQEHSAMINKLSHDGRGIANIQGKTTFLFAGLAGEQVRFRYNSLHARFDEGEVTAVDLPSPVRVTPKCAYFGVCGGCQLQHMDYDSQLLHKQQVLLELLERSAGAKPQRVFAPLSASPWGYRQKARLSVRYLAKKDEVLVGFRERDTGRKITRMQHCEVLNPKIGRYLSVLNQMVRDLDCPGEIPQFEVAIDDQCVAIIIRHLKPLSASDAAVIKKVAQQHDWQIYLQAKGPESIRLFFPETADPLLYYQLPEYGLTLQFKPQQFTQVNSALNLKMVAKAIELLDLQVDDHVLDLFAGIGNFTLPIATRCQQVTAVEGCQDAVNQGQINAVNNHLTNISYYQADLFSPPFQPAWANRCYNKVLLDPPRAGASAIIAFLSIWKVERVVYVSCDPATMARDCQAIVASGYDLLEVGVIDMFAQTQHMEVMALFVMR